MLGHPLRRHRQRHRRRSAPWECLGPARAGRCTRSRQSSAAGRLRMTSLTGSMRLASPRRDPMNIRAPSDLCDARRKHPRSLPRDRPCSAQILLRYHVFGAEVKRRQATCCPVSWATFLRGRRILPVALRQKLRDELTSARNGRIPVADIQRNDLTRKERCLMSRSSDPPGVSAECGLDRLRADHPLQSAGARHRPREAEHRRDRHRRPRGRRHQGRRGREPRRAVRRR